jgi:site-specific DNA-methyltransferase (adenine-specific)
MINKLILGDNLEILKTMEAESVDLVYLDPPFFSNRNYEVIWGDAGEIRSFQDRWSGGVEHYIAWLKERVAELHRVLKPTGSLYLHCDWHADAYIRVHILDRLFGMNNFRNEIVWKRATSGSSKSVAKKFGIDHDSIFYYVKSQEANFKSTYIDYPEKEIEKRFKRSDERGRYKDAELATYSQETFERLKKENKLIITESGKYRYKIYLSEVKGVLADDIWTDIPPVNSQAAERIGYPTQKPEALLERIIKASSNEGCLVLDPFMGGGATIAVADRLGRQWIGIDQSAMAVKVMELRLQWQAGLFTSPYTVQLHKYDYDTLRYKDAFEFESWIVQQFGGTPQNKKGGDKGVDGKAADGAPIQVKRSDNVGVNVIKNFSVSAKQFDKTLFEKNQADRISAGSFCLQRSSQRQTVQKLLSNLLRRLQENMIIKLVTVEVITPIAAKPALGVHINELERERGISAGSFLSRQAQKTQRQPKVARPTGRRHRVL